MPFGNIGFWNYIYISIWIRETYCANVVPNSMNLPLKFCCKNARHLYEYKN